MKSNREYLKVCMYNKDKDTKISADVIQQTIRHQTTKTVNYH